MTDSEPQADARPNLPEYSVSELSGALKRAIEDQFGFVRVRGELGGVKRHTSGHIYLDLKDEKAVLAGVVWRGTRLGVQPEQGLEVIATGRLTTFAGQSKYQLVIERLELAGLGALMKQLEERRKRLAAEGLFADSAKQPLPFLPRVIGVVTSPTGAVIRDILHRLADRFPRHVLVWPVAVQGERAAGEIAAAIDGFNALAPGGPVPRPDVLIVARGGGSFEDLMPFNEEIVVRAAAASTIPLISAVGHETDTTLIDFAADRRAPTPTAAAEMAVPVRADLILRVGALAERMTGTALREREQRRQRLRDLARSLARPQDVVNAAAQRLDGAAGRLEAGLRARIAAAHLGLARIGGQVTPRLVAQPVALGADRLAGLAARLRPAVTRGLADRARELGAAGKLIETLSHKATLERGFVLVRAADGTLRPRAGTLAPGEALTLVFADGTREVRAGGGAGGPESPAPGTGDRTAPAPGPAPRRRTRAPGQGNLF